MEYVLWSVANKSNKTTAVLGLVLVSTGFYLDPPKGAFWRFFNIQKPSINTPWRVLVVHSFELFWARHGFAARSTGLGGGAIGGGFECGVAACACGGRPWEGKAGML